MYMYIYNENTVFYFNLSSSIISRYKIDTINNKKTVIPTLINN